ncbi:tRNA 2-thiouridine(34) synthase MnmA [Candidatus Babeliales bacterium]|nr:tRNA 2-thiouridine(34) synthase MnmA [Candidatus Babeliales bacterium]
MAKKIAVLVSGGVDSSVALALLKQQGHDLTAFYLKIWLEDELSYLGSCPWQQDLDFVQSVCAKLDVPLKVISMQQAYHDRVVHYLLSEIKRGNTPNPDILCNQQIKFGAFFDAIGSDFEYVATGHYAQIEHGPEISVLKKGKDPVKDQTYFLAYLNQAQLRKTLFPMGHLEKFQVRALAQELGLPTAQRPDSQGICFLGKFKFEDFLKAHIKNEQGPIVEFETGKILGMHDGFWFYTIGQRHGLKLSAGPWYVVKKDIKINTVYVSKAYESVAEYKHGMIVRDFIWNQGCVSVCNTLDVRFRHGPAVHACTVQFDGSYLKIMLNSASKQGIAQGQFAVLYDGDVCLGGGVIEQAV